MGHPPEGNRYTEDTFKGKCYRGTYCNPRNNGRSKVSTTPLAAIRLSGPNIFSLGLVFVSLSLIWRAVTLDVFIDESDSPPSETANDLRGVKATKGNRILLGTIALSCCAFAIWKLVKG